MYDFDKIVDRRNTSSIKFDLRKQIFETEDLIPMWVADMDFETPEFIRNAVINRANHPIFGYSMRGESYNNSIKNWLSRRHGWEIDNSWIVFSPGIVPALNFSTLAFTKEGDGIIVQPPVYFPFFTAATDHGRILLENQLEYENDSYGIDFVDFENKAKSATMFFLSSPHNPVGRLWTRDELERLGNICVENDVIIISDEIHNDLILPGKTHVPIATISPEIADITITCIAPSKTFNLAGMATSSLIISNEELRQKFEKQLNAMHLSLGNVFGAVASEAAYNHGEIWLEELMNYINSNINLLLDELSETKIKVIPPEATYMVWLDFRNTGLSDDEIKHKLIHEAKIGLSHGPLFGAGGEGFQRINLATPVSIVEEALEALKRTFNKDV